MTIISGRKKITPPKKKSEAIRVRIWLVRILSCSQVITGCALFWLSKMAMRTDIITRGKVLMKQE